MDAVHRSTPEEMPIIPECILEMSSKYDCDFPTVFLYLQNMQQK